MATGLPNGDPIEVEGRLESTISIRIGEIKNLPPSHELRHGTRDAYVITALDQEEIFRTAGAEKTLNPFFGEEYNFRVPRDFRRLSFYIYDSDPFALSIAKDSRLGKVAISKEDLLAGRAAEDKWYPVLPIVADSEVQGKVQLAVSVVEKMVDGVDTSGVIRQFLSIRVLSCCGLSAWGTSGLSDPFCQVQLFNSQGQQTSEVKRGQVKKKTLDPDFNEIFEFPIEVVKNFTDTLCRVSLWHQQVLHSEPIFLGEVILSLALFNTSALRVHTAWYNLGSRLQVVSHPPPKVELGSLRVRVVLSQDCIYPLRQYETLKTLLLDSLVAPDITQSAVYLLSEVYKDRSAMGRSLVKIFVKLNRIEELMIAIIEHEVSATSDPNTLFRGNSLASKVIDEFMKLVGQPYLQRTLQSCIDEIFEAKRSCEIDASKVQEGEHLDLNMANLLFFIEKILSAITASARSCPRLMCTVFSILKEAAVRKFPEKRETVQYSAVSGFVFLRFFAPAILNPKLFRLRPEYPPPVVARTLTLISKSIQNLGNIGSRGVWSGSLARKEDFMAPLNAQLMDPSHIKEVKEYLTAVSDPRGGQECVLDDMVFREGLLVKRSQGRKRGPKNWRKRHFCLTADSLRYSKAKADSPALCTIPAHELLAVERVDDNAFGLRFMFQLIQPERILYMQAKNSVDLMEWLAALSKACSHTHRETELFHSGAYLNGLWTCCGGPVEDGSGGCKPVSLAIRMLGNHEDIDLERELHKIYKMFLEGQEKLLQLKDEASTQARDKGELLAGTPLPQRLAILFELLMFVKNLELSCNSHIASKTGRLGTKESPYQCKIGEAHVVK